MQAANLLAFPARLPREPQGLEYTDDLGCALGFVHIFLRNTTARVSFALHAQWRGIAVRRAGLCRDRPSFELTSLQPNLRHTQGEAAAPHRIQPERAVYS